MLWVVVYSANSHGAADVAGSEDVKELDRYPLSSIVQYNQSIVPEYRLALGTMKKVNGVLSPENAEYINGLLTRITYRIPSGHGSRDAFDFVTEQLKPIPHQVVFECQGRSCGSSSAWANSQFGISKLYGIDREQHYRVVRLNGDKPTTMVFYAVRRGNKRVYLHIDRIQAQGAVALRGAEQLLGKMLKSERVVVSLKDWTEDEVASVAAAITALLTERPLSTIWLVGHQAKQGPFVRLRNDSMKYVSEFRQRLVEQGIDEHRLKLLGIGPLAPAYTDSVPENRIELVVE
ncbi:MAG: DUF4892 domain-containing protein [Motiliproteus sp.]